MLGKDVTCANYIDVYSASSVKLGSDPKRNPRKAYRTTVELADLVSRTHSGVVPI